MHSRVSALDRPVFTFRLRDLPALAGGVLVFWFVFNGPPIDRIAGVDLRFGLTGPASSIIWHWVGAALIIVWVLVIERRPLASLLLVRLRREDVNWVLWGAGAAIVAGTVLFLLSTEVAQGLDVIVAMGVSGVLLMVVTAAVTEEIVYRGYLAERFGCVARSRLIGAVASFILFVAPHVIHFGWQWLLGPVLGALAIAVSAYLRRNLWVAMLIHAAVNLPIVIPAIRAG